MNRLGLLFVLAGLIQSTAAQCTGPNCQTCAGEICLQCDDHYTQNEAQTTCCSDGCLQDSDGWPLCGVDGVCTYADCNDGYIGPECKRCDTVIDNCDICHEFTLTRDIHCTKCATNYHITPDNQQCCSEGCNDCTSSPEEDNCLTCQQGWYKYNNICDRCGENCVVPSDGSARCDPTGGRCYLGCMDGWHGMRCNVSCDISRCDECNYDEPNTRLTCIDCNPGFYDTDCKSCSANCVRSTDINVCRQDGFCLEGCTPGFRGDRCDIRCDQATGLENCNLCERFNYKCTECKPGYHGDTCQLECNVNCAPNLANVVECDLNNGTCNSGCLTQHYKSDCSGECLNCINDICERESGICVQERCKPGFFGPACTLACPVTCANNSVTGQPECEFKNGTCIHGCYYNQHGPYCSKSCSQFCVAVTQTRTDFSPASCVQETGACINACQDNYYLPNCTKTCNAPCVDDKCDINTGTCLACEVDDPGYLCPEGTCPVGLWGRFCNQTCPANCLGGGCERDLGVCTACNDGYYKTRCDGLCPNCADGKCFQADGECVFGCTDGWYTAGCNTQCLHEGCQDCTRDSGECIRCKPGKFGNEDCSGNCSRFCSRNTDQVITCNKLSGSCDEGSCLQGHWGQSCGDTCSPYCSNSACDIDTGACTPCVLGWYGQTCSSECSARCKNKNCVSSADQCREGCADGYWGAACEFDCSANCRRDACDRNTGSCLFGCENDGFWGDSCLEACGVNCVGGTCNTTGHCLNGCEVGWYSAQCRVPCLASSKCIDGTCGRLNGLCPDCLAATPGANCPTADCAKGKRGDNCDLDCTSDNCLYDQCGRYDDECVACPLTFYGTNCQSSCPNCKDGTACNKATGVCLVGCNDGWYGPLCNLQCNDVCASCERNTGLCVTCISGRYGGSCENICSSNCMFTAEGSGIERIYCDKGTGACSEDACKPGFWLPTCTNTCGDNCRVDQNGLKYCALLDGQCTNGCKEKFFGKTCDGVCSTRCQGQLCKDNEDTCTLGCQAGYYGPTCSGVCSSFCAGNGDCDSVSGKCNQGCQSGYYGDRCLDQCISSCLDGTCDVTGICPDCKLEVVGPQCRVQECAVGKYGPICENDCPGAYCNDNKCDRKKGTCSQGCLDNYHGIYCTEQCNCEGAGTSNCDQTTGECLCIATRYGPRCEQQCNDGCVDFVCSKSGSCTNGCKLGRFGSMCASTCIHCKDLDCSATTGSCNQGCNDGWFGEMCDRSCPSNCQTCDQTSGTCTTCKSLYYGPATNCGQVCSGRCAQTNGPRQCDQSTGACLAGCQDGFYGSDCAEACGNCESGTCNSQDGSCSAQGCAAGWFGSQCKQSCNQNCARGGNSNSVRCDPNTGSCSYGCVDGYHGSRCTSVCNSRCLNNRCTGATQCTEGCTMGYYGSGCSSECRNCVQGACNSAGVCQNGCLNGYYGTSCTDACWETCRDNSCDVTSGGCSACLTSPKGALCRDEDPVAAGQIDKNDLTTGEIVGIAGGCIAIVIIFVVVFVCCIIYMRRAEDAKNEIHLPSDLVERLSTHRSLHSTVSTNYPVARVVGDPEKDFVLF